MCYVYLHDHLVKRKNTAKAFQAEGTLSLDSACKRTDNFKLLMAEPLTVGIGIGWGMKAAGWIASPIISEIFKKASPYLGFDASKKLKELEMKILLLEQGMEMVEESPHRNRLQQLFEDLRSAFYEAEEILDDVEYYCLKKQIEDTKMYPDSDTSPHKRDWVKKL